MRSEGKTFVAEIVENYGIVVQGKGSPSDPDWEKVLDFYRALLAANKTRVLVYTEGAAPSASQRGRLQEVLGKKKVVIAVLTPSAWARAVGTALSWFIPNVGMFKPTELDDAFDHLQAGPADRALLREKFQQLREWMTRAEGGASAAAS